MNMKEKPKIIVILGQTASGKSSLAVHLAKKFGGEVISADSRQVYQGLTIGTEKITKKEMRGIPHHLLDIASPRRVFTVAQFTREADKTIRYIVRNGKVPIVAGGTGFYIQALVDGTALPEVKPNATLRRKLEKKTPEQLLTMLKKLDPRRAKTIEKKNKRRLIRAIEIAKGLGKVPKTQSKSKYNVLQIGIQMDDKTLRERINKRLLRAVRRGLVAEIKQLHNTLSWKRINELGLEYKIAGQYLRGEIDRKKMIETMQNAVWQYAKRQKTWFTRSERGRGKRDKRIKWFTPSAVEGFTHKDKKQIENEVRKFLSM